MYTTSIPVNPVICVWTDWNELKGHGYVCPNHGKSLSNKWEESYLTARGIPPPQKLNVGFIL